MAALITQSKLCLIQSITIRKVCQRLIADQPAGLKVARVPVYANLETPYYNTARFQDKRLMQSSTYFTRKKLGGIHRLKINPER